MWPCIEAAQLLSAFPGLTHENLEFPMIDEASQAAEQNPQVGRLTNHIQNRWVVRVLMVMRHNIGVYQTNTLEQNRARAAAVINNTSATLWIPDHILEEDEFPPHPILWPIVRFEEAEIIPLHRCLCLLEYLAVSHGSVEKRERYLDVRVYCSDDDLEVTEEDIPGWMRHTI